MELRKISDKHLIVPVLIMLAYFVVRLFDEAKIMWIFPLDYVNDVSSVMVQLWFLAKYGFHGLVPYWYGGFELFNAYFPAWFYFALPLYYLFGSVQIAWYVALILVFCLALMLFFVLARVCRWSWIKGLAYFTFFFCNSYAIGSFVRLGRTAEFFAWLWFIALFVLVWNYKDKKLDRWSLLFIPVFAVLMMSHLAVAIIGAVLLFSLFLVKGWRERGYLVLYGLASVALTLFWLVSYVKHTIVNSPVFTDAVHTYTNRLFMFNERWLYSNLFGIFVALLFIALFFVYYFQENKSRRILLFFAPSLIFASLFLSRLVYFIPVMRNIFPEVYSLYFLFLSLFLFFGIRFDKKMEMVLCYSLLFFAVASVVFSCVHTPWFVEHTELDDEVDKIFPEVNGKFLMFNLGDAKTSYGKAYYCYAPLYYNLSTVSGWSQQAARRDYLELLSRVQSSVKNKDCNGFLLYSRQIGLENAIGFGQVCSFFERCGLSKLDSGGVVCLYLV